MSRAERSPVALLLVLLLAGPIGCGFVPERRTIDTVAAPTLRLATFNAHVVVLDRPDGPWSQKAWKARRTAFDAAFKSLDADLVALQEMNGSSRSGRVQSPGPARAWLAARNPGYGVVGGDADGAPPFGQPIFYRTARFDVLANGWFPFSLARFDPNGPGLGNTEPAHASWVRLRDRRAGRDLTLLNVHFHHRRSAPQRHAARLVARFVAPLLARGEAVLLAGDLNVRLASRPVAIMEGAGLRFLRTRGTTFHFNRGVNILGAIDHIAHSAQFELRGGPRIHRDRFDGIWPSDHYPVSATVSWTRGPNRTGTGRTARDGAG